MNNLKKNVIELEEEISKLRSDLKIVCERNADVEDRLTRERNLRKRVEKIQYSYKKSSVNPMAVAPMIPQMMGTVLTMKFNRKRKGSQVSTVKVKVVDQKRIQLRKRPTETSQMSLQTTSVSVK